MSAVKARARALIRKEWDPIRWEGSDKDPDEAGDVEPLNSDEAFFTSGSGLPASSKSGIHARLSGSRL